MQHSFRSDKKIYRFGIALLSLSLTIGALWYSFANGYERTKTKPNLSPLTEKRADQKPITLLFGGDVMLDRYIRTNMRRHGDDFIFQPLAETLQQADAVIANLEGPITENASVSEASRIGEAKNYVFTFAPNSTALLKRKNISIVNLGNNHILNFKEDGVQQTKKFLAAADIESFGSPLAGDRRVLIKSFGDLNVAFVNYNQFIYQGQEKAFEDIAEARTEADIVILYTHWGTEYVAATLAIKELAHQFITAGADVIIGSHPHVVQETEVYQGKTIYYSLGNFIFDQYFQKEVQRGILVRMTIEPLTKKLSFQDIPIALHVNGQTVIAPEEE